MGSTYQLDFHPAQLALADFNENGNVDILVRGSKNEVTLLLGDGKGGFQRASDARSILKEFMVRHGADDRKLMPCLKTSDSRSCVPAMAGNSGLTSWSSSPLQAGITDVNGDGLEDILLHSDLGQDSNWLRATANGEFYLMKARGQAGKQNAMRTVSLAHGDIDGNGLRSAPDRLSVWGWG